MTDQLDHLKHALADRYAIEREIGRGAAAVVYLAEDLKHHRKVALKVLHPELAASLGPERFLREIEIAAALTHPHILAVHDSGLVDHVLYYVMPYVEDESLRERLARDHRVPLEEAVQIAREVASALDYAHRHGVVHRDIKPANTLLADGHAVVADFGIARAVTAAGQDRLTHPGLAVGTPAYMSPEQAMGNAEVDGRSDIYSLGRLLYEMLVGELPAAPTDRRGALAGRLSRVPASHVERLATIPRPVVRTLARALALDPADRFQTAEEFAASLGGFVVPRSRPRRWLWIGTAAALLAVAVGTVLIRRPAPTLDPDVVAIAPFDVLDPRLSLWHEGLADMLAASLDGVGPLRTVPPSVVLRRWQGHADPVYAASLGSRVGAGLVLYGRLVAIGGDSVRATGALLDVAHDRSVAEFDLRDRADRVDRLADSLAMQIMDELSRARGFSGWRLASLGSSSPLALKAFLQGEQYYRRFGLDSAEWYFTRALEQDSGFALAYTRRAMAAGWASTVDPEYASSMLHAGALNHGLARRESLLVAADSIRGALVQFQEDSAGAALVRRLLATLTLAAQQYPSDPSVWYGLGEARYHQGPYVGVTDQDAYDAFSRAVALDSAFVPPYRHLLELTVLLKGSEPARRVVREYVARTDPGVFRDAARVTGALLDEEHSADSETTAALHALNAEGYFQVWYDLKWWRDSAEAATRVARAWMDATHSNAATFSLVLELAYRGHLREASALVGDRQPALFVVLARLGTIPADSADSVIAGWLEQPGLAGVFHAQRWWGERGDTASLRRAIARWEAAAEGAPAGTRAAVEHAARSGRAYLALARGDTAQALRLFAAIPNSPSRSYFGYYEQLTRARLLSRLGRDREAVQLLDHMPFERQWAPTADAVLVDLERGRLHERLGEHQAAVGAYAAVVAAWRRADPELRPLVAEARAALARLSTEPRR